MRRGGSSLIRYRQHTPPRAAQAGAHRSDSMLSKRIVGTTVLAAVAVVAAAAACSDTGPTSQAALVYGPSVAFAQGHAEADPAQRSAVGGQGGEPAGRAVRAGRLRAAAGADRGERGAADGRALDRRARAGAQREAVRQHVHLRLVGRALHLPRAD